MEMIRSVLQQLSQVAKVDYNDQFDVFELELFLNELRNVFETDEEEKIPISISNAQLERDQFDSTGNLSCDYHENEDLTKYCALSFVRRWFYDCCDYVLDKFQIEMLPGKHKPKVKRFVAPVFDDWDDADEKVKVELKSDQSDDDESDDDERSKPTPFVGSHRYAPLVESEEESD